MIELPSNLPGRDTNSINVIADWVELCALADGEALSRERVATAYAGLYGYTDSGDADDLNQLAEDTWVELRRRQALLGDQYPLAVHSSTLETISDLRSCPSFVFLLLAATAGHYGRGEGEELAKLFEHVVTASAKGLLGGRAARFGWPPDKGARSSVRDRIECFAQELGLEAQNLGGKVGPYDKDMGLDVAARHAVGGSAAGSVVFLIQCATGKNWRNKGKASVNRWKELIQWNARPVPAFAVPWWWAKDEEYIWYFRRMDHVIVLDRARLLQGGPDCYLEGDRRAEVEDWARKQLTALPRL